MAHILFHDFVQSFHHHHLRNNYEQVRMELMLILQVCVPIYQDTMHQLLLSSDRYYCHCYRRHIVFGNILIDISYYYEVKEYIDYS